jgi:site-specific DNA-methyltransferase (adenine-specific)
MLNFTTQKIPITEIDANIGQIPDVPRNPRKIDDADLASLKKSIAADPDFLDLWKVTVFPQDGRFVAIAGNQRLRACRELKIPAITCDVLDASTPPEIMRKIVIKANRQAGEDDLDLLKLEWDFSELNEMWDFPELEVAHDSQLLEEAENDETLDEMPEFTATRCKEGDVWELGEHRLLCGDATVQGDYVRLMDGQTADLLLTDPPYGVDYTGGSKVRDRIDNDAMDATALLDFLTQALKNCTMAMKQGAGFYIWHADLNGAIFRESIQKAGLTLRQVLIWNKNHMSVGRQDYQWRHEPCLYGWKSGKPHYFVDDRKQVTVQDDPPLDPHKMKKPELEALVMKLLDLPSTVIDEARPMRALEHPTMKPVRLMARLIRNSTQAGQLVLDPFGGSGSTLIAAEKLGRRCFTMEIDPHYCDVILTRWERMTGKNATKAIE